MGIGFFKFLKELFNGTYFNKSSDNNNGNTFSDGSSGSVFGFLNPQNWRNAVDDITKSDDYLPGQEKSLYDSLGLGELGLSGLFSALTNRITAEHLTGAEREANAFSAEQAQIDRDFQERMANTQYQRSVADMRAAGVNPALAMSNGGAAAPSGQAASSVQPQGQAMNMSDLMHLMMLKPQIEMMRAQTENIAADTSKKQSETELVGKHISAFDVLTDAEIRDIDSRIVSRDVQNALNKQGINESEARQALYAQQTINEHISEEYISKLNDAQLVYQQALTAYTNQHTKESEQAVRESAARIDGIYQQAILQAAMAGYYSQSEANLLEQQGILQYDKEQHKFTVDHQKSDRNWRIASTVVGMAQGVGQTAASGAIGIGMLGRAGIIGNKPVVSASPWSFHNTGGYNWIGY